MNAAAAKLLEGITGDMSPYERELAIHDRLVEQTAYDESQSQPQIHNLYGVLVNRLAVCDGYSKAFQYLLYQAGVPCLFVTGQSQGEGHAWNLVQLDGAYYHVDITWDDPVYNGIREADQAGVLRLFQRHHRPNPGGSHHGCRELSPAGLHPPRR